MSFEQMDQQVRNAPRKTIDFLKKSTRAIKLGIKVVKWAILLIKLMIVKAKFILIALAVMAAFTLIYYVFYVTPYSLYNELMRDRLDGFYSGSVMSFFLDIDEERDEEVDQAAMEYYKSYEDKCLDGLDEFQKLQASPYALPYALLIAIDRETYTDSSLLKVWQPDSAITYQELKTHYDWIDSEINYEIQISYSYEYSYKFETTHEWSWSDCDGESDSGTDPPEEHSVEGSGESTVTISFLHDVKLLEKADAFDHEYLFEYDELIIKEDIVVGWGNYTEPSGMAKEFEMEPDQHGSFFINEPIISVISRNFEEESDSENTSAAEYLEEHFETFPEEDAPPESNNETSWHPNYHNLAQPDQLIASYVEEWIDNLFDQIRANALTIEGYPITVNSYGDCENDDGEVTGSWSNYSNTYISRQPYDIVFNFEYIIDSATKEYQPLLEINTVGNKFEKRFFPFTTQFFGYESLSNMDQLLYTTADYDQNFAYNYSANDMGLYFSGFHSSPLFYDGLLGVLTWPVADPGYRANSPGSRISSPFGPRSAVRSNGRIVSAAGFHGGVDIASGGRNVPILAASDGKVIFAGMNGSMTSGYGRTVIIDHGIDDAGRSIMTLYAHLHSINVRYGQDVETAEQIGVMGTTGSSSGIHLHFEIRVDSGRQDPLRHYPREAYQDYL